MAHILIVTNIPTPYRLALLKELDLQLRRLNHSVEVVFAGDTEAGRNWVFKSDDSHVRSTVLNSRLNRGVFAYTGLLSLVKRIAPDVVIVGGFGVATVKLWACSFASPIPYVIWSGATAGAHWENTWLRRLVRRMLVARASGFIAYSAAARDYLIALGAARENVHVALNAVDVEYFERKAADLSGADRTLRFIYVGALTTRKRVDLAIKAFSVVVRQRPTARLVIAGDGPSARALHNLVSSLGVEESVIFLGFKQIADLPDLFSEACCMLFPTSYDIWGLVVNEAMASGVPCIASRHAVSAVELIDDGVNGFTVDFEATLDVADKMFYLCDHPAEAAAMGRAAQGKSQEHRDSAEGCGDDCDQPQSGYWHLRRMTMVRHKRGRLLIIGPLPPPYAGPEIGTEIFVNSGTLRNAFDCRVINTTVRTSNSEKGKTDLTIVVAYVRYVWRLVSALLFFRPDTLIYRPTSATVKGWVRDGTTILFGSLAGCQVILQFGGGHFRFFYESLGRFGKTVIRRLLGNVAVVLAESNGLRRQFAGLLPENRIGVLPTAVPDAFYAHFEKVHRVSRESPLIVLFVGHLSQAKGYCDLLKVIAFLAGKYDVKFHFMGARVSGERNIFFNQLTQERIRPEDPDECFARYITAQGIKDRVVFLGDQVAGVDKLAAFERASIFALPSYSEGFSRATLEAMAAGLPLVVTRVGAVPDIVDDGVNGFVVDPGDVAQLQAGLDKLLGDPALRAKMSAANRKRCEEEFLAECVSSRLVETIRSV